MKMTCPDLMCVNERQKAVIDATTAALQVAADAALADAFREGEEEQQRKNNSSGGSRRGRRMILS